MRKIDGEVRADLDVHLVLDNASTHKTPAVMRWLTNHPRFVLHFTPTSSSWLNLVERWFAELTTKKLRRGAHTWIGTAALLIHTALFLLTIEPKAAEPSQGGQAVSDDQ